ncbi:hypothetical protein ACFFRR_008691 [Megaselia abdita]
MIFTRKSRIPLKFLVFVLISFFVICYIFPTIISQEKQQDDSFFFQRRLISSSLLYKKDNYTLVENEQNEFESWIQRTNKELNATSNWNSILNNTNNSDIFIESILSTSFNSSSLNSNTTSSSNYVQSIKSFFTRPKCPQYPSRDAGPIQADTVFENLETVEKRLKNLLLTGGYFRPRNCTSKDKVAIIVPFRDRYAHLPIFLKNIHPFLMRQQIEYKIFIVEQTNGLNFNRAALMNVGYLEASKMKRWDCFIFHDIDLLPLDDRNYYNCPDQPRHMSGAVDVFDYKLPYKTIFGGVSALRKEQFAKINGFSNSFWGWGGEDDDMSNRIRHANYHISRYPINISRYRMLNHKKEKANPKRYDRLNSGVTKFTTDGLNSIKYEIYKYNKFPLFTWFLVELKMSE